MQNVPSKCTAVVLSDFGDASKLNLSEISTPILHHPDEILVRVKATGVNPIEWKMREGMVGIRYVGRLLLGNPMILGLDFAGEVVATGKSITDFKTGDLVFGTVPFGGCYSQYLKVRPSNRQTAIAHKPKEFPVDKAGTTAFASLIAYAGLVTYGGLKVTGNKSAKGKSRVLIVGASGGVGHLAVQMAKHCLEASLVVGVCSSRNKDFAISCGADEVLEYDKIKSEEIVNQHPEWANSFDLIYDTIGQDNYFTRVGPQVLKRKTGRFVTAAPPPTTPGRPGEDAGFFDGLILASKIIWRSIFRKYSLITGLFGGLPTKDGFGNIVEWLDEGKLNTEIWKTFQLSEIRKAHEASETGRAVGKISVTLD
jgi:NADPH:quinone reductase-like Zn-dependent oxidoreductase